MNTKEVINKTAESANLTRQETTALIEALASVISEELTNGNIVHIRQFGDFEVRERKERVMVHPQTGAKTLIPQKRQAVFKQTTYLKEELKEASK